MSRTSDGQRAPVPVQHPLVQAIEPLLERIGATLVPVSDRAPEDVVLVWKGEDLAAVRLADSGENPSETGESGGLAHLIEEVATELGGPLATAQRVDKQRAVRLLEERGAFGYRKSAETIAEALGVSRFTVYNYLNRDRTG